MTQKNRLHPFANPPIEKRTLGELMYRSLVSKKINEIVLIGSDETQLLYIRPSCVRFLYS